LKIAQGGYVPLALAGAVYLIMWIGIAVSPPSRAHPRKPHPDRHLHGEAKAGLGSARAGHGLTRATCDTPPVLIWHVRHNSALQEHVLAITTQIEPVPWIADEKRATVAQEVPGFWRASVRYGFMERPQPDPRAAGERQDRTRRIDLIT
jgi:KUP system potassium uptake protein